ncbi:hypothetical protein M495_15395 [Serratia liquefaciens ATCC 27592]|nr:hypothetical protein M495_15395 [Serratia liquefaciens ATCC 27592]
MFKNIRWVIIFIARDLGLFPKLANETLNNDRYKFFNITKFGPSFSI